MEKVSDDASESSGEESSVGEEEKNESVVVPHSPPRRDFTMSTASTLQKLTEGDTLEDGEESEWLIIKVPKEMQQEGELFLVDYVDGDTEDEFKWLEGPHCQAHTTVQDLLDRRRTLSRIARRRQGHTELEMMKILI